MHLYRIVFERFADRLYAPGFSGRWNYDGEFVIYAGSSRSLASMENMVHKMGQGILGGRFTIMVLEVPNKASVTVVSQKDLPKSWKVESHYALTQPIGSAWYQKGESLLLQVPSAIVPAENNFVLNARHPEFAQVQIIAREPFEYDHRFIFFDKTLAGKKKE
ncbi:RES family NAD+ phosphorylase [Rufibacter roseus]|uniref:RES family NAD+ phosphorylase n=1 Tax=Rufibacter roseus TaxID=1567108 RepID=A0ABW2DPI2_9BACT|nr:RES family NAD+ phosphorylase [Rufibacter roseus]